MTTYIVARSRAGLDAGDAARGGQLGALAESLTDLRGAQYQGLIDQQTGEPGVGRSQWAPDPGHDGLGWVSAYSAHRSLGMAPDAVIRVWVRAVADWTTPLTEARDRLKATNRERVAQIAARDDAIRAALTDGQDAKLIAYHAGLSVERVYQIRDGRR